jgi:hypothetical protein
MKLPRHDWPLWDVGDDFGLALGVPLKAEALSKIRTNTEAQ